MTTKIPAIPSLEGITDKKLLSVLAPIKEILEIREGVRGDEDLNAVVDLETLSAPTITDFTDAQHDHKSASGGGDYPWADFVAADVTYLQALVADIIQTNLVDKSATETISGAWTFNNANGLTVSTGLTLNHRTLTANDNIIASDFFVDLDGTSTTVTAFLPTAAGITGKIFEFKCIDDTNTITIDGFGTETIDGELTETLILDEVLTVRSDGTNWRVVF